MVIDENQKEVNFEKYCKECKYEKTDEVKDPCNECLGVPMNLYSEKPINFKKKER